MCSLKSCTQVLPWTLPCALVSDVSRLANEVEARSQRWCHLPTVHCSHVCTEKFLPWKLFHWLKGHSDVLNLGYAWWWSSCVHVFLCVRAAGLFMQTECVRVCYTACRCWSAPPPAGSWTGKKWRPTTTCSRLSATLLRCLLCLNMGCCHQHMSVCMLKMPLLHSILH